MHGLSPTTRQPSLLHFLVMLFASITSAFRSGSYRFLSRTSLQQASLSSRSLTFFPHYRTLTFHAKDQSIRAFSQTSSDTETNKGIDSKHRKSYHIQGMSTSPKETATENPTSDGKRARRRREGSGPGVTLHTVKTHHTLQTDVPKAMGGDNLAPQPVETLLAALIGCTQATALFVGRQLGIVIDNMEFDIIGARDERGALQLPIETTPEVPSRLQEITGTVKVYTSELLPEETMVLLREQTENRCPVANMVLASGCKMNVEWISVISAEIDN